ncbi:hypothetical protein, partial [Phenylobacterium sp.]|uniref:hypothetical protein n=1 Tax=Phenylobacterium sp. TaxID=1871053 RepID=UPI002731E4F8
PTLVLTEFIGMALSFHSGRVSGDFSPVSRSWLAGHIASRAPRPRLRGHCGKPLIHRVISDAKNHAAAKHVAHPGAQRQI